MRLPIRVRDHGPVVWTITAELDAFVAAAGGFLRSDPVANTVTLGALEALRASGTSLFGPVPPLFGWWRTRAHAGQQPIGGAFMHTPPYPVLLTRQPRAAAADLATELAGRGWELPGVNANEAEAEAFAAAWAAATGTAIERGPVRRLFRLAGLVPPDPAPAGAARLATAADKQLLAHWYAAFGAEVGDSFTDVDSAVAEKLSHGGLTLWEDDGRPVSMAGITRKAAGVVRLGPVYTPAEHRGRGYGAAATFAVSRAAVDDGADEVVLYTDLSNPVSNRLYPRLGYVAVEDRELLTFR